jgi:hypothetical protein
MALSILKSGGAVTRPAAAADGIRFVLQDGRFYMQYAVGSRARPEGGRELAEFTDFDILANDYETVTEAQ